ncbi:hypothetical protein B0A49_03439 [Cryomyces minteri]|uniref:GRAM domain-containing protein n=1 Tax=Cryomyces minteri TaxID=331657 RepID=A0A4U0XA82_9PEZI|nr:hypothetical protein B0A49_03439 [Cryomyces minteri]
MGLGNRPRTLMDSFQTMGDCTSSEDSNRSLTTSHTEDLSALKAEANDEYNLPDPSTYRQAKPSKRERIKSIGHKTKWKAKHLLHIDDTKERVNLQNAEQYGALGNIEDNPAFNPSRLLKKKRLSVGGTADKAVGVIRTAAQTIVHPKGAIKNKAANTLAASEHPYLSQQADMDFLKAHEELHNARSSTGDSPEDDDENVNKCKSVVDDLEGHRESMRVAWTTSRYIERVRVVPKEHISFPQRESFREYDMYGNFVRFQWEKYLGHLLIYATQDFAAQYVDDFEEPPFDRDTLIKHVERLIMASGPWQEWISGLRQLYRWEDPKRTGKWLAVWAVIWYLDYVITFIYAYIAYVVLANRYSPKPVEAMRESYKRAVDRGSDVFKFSELINRHGGGGWIDPLIDELGPQLQLQLGDLADFLEVVINFYEWTYPSKTAASVFFLLTCIAVGLLASSGFSIKVCTLVTIGTFFFGWPVASLHPRYRKLVSPLRCIFWDIPTHAEWSFMYLRRQAQLTREKLIGQKVEQVYKSTDIGGPLPYAATLDVPHVTSTGPAEILDADEDDDAASWHTADSSSSILDGIDFISFRCRSGTTPGRLVVYSSGIRFMRSFPSKQLWRRSFLELVEMRKISGSTVAKLMNRELLEFKFMDGTTTSVEAMKQRDEAFNTIIGFSGLQWQQLQPGPGKEGNGTDSKTKRKKTDGSPQKQKHFLSDPSKSN